MPTINLFLRLSLKKLMLKKRKMTRDEILTPDIENFNL